MSRRIHQARELLGSHPRLDELEELLDAMTNSERLTFIRALDRRAQSALYAADAGVSAALDVLRTDIVTAALAPGDCLTGTIPTGAN